jgi:(1->4)-alpha-D-glucan 1-alpha-D-glucosylmutase
LKLTAPGVPDIYQGDELPFRALVDPDNRRPVDWERRRTELRRLAGGATAVAETRKLFVIQRLLDLRARRPEAFNGGAYEPLAAGAEVCAFLRSGEVLVVVRVRGAADGALGGDAAGEVAGGRWRDVLTDEVRSGHARMRLADLVGDHSIAVFERIGP